MGQTTFATNISFFFRFAILQKISFAYLNVCKFFLTAENLASLLGLQSRLSRRTWSTSGWLLGLDWWLSHPLIMVSLPLKASLSSVCRIGSSLWNQSCRYRGCLVSWGARFELRIAMIGYNAVRHSHLLLWVVEGYALHYESCFQLREANTPRTRNYPETQNRSHQFSRGRKHFKCWQSTSDAKYRKVR